MFSILYRTKNKEFTIVNGGLSDLMFQEGWRTFQCEPSLRNLDVQNIRKQGYQETEFALDNEPSHILKNRQFDNSETVFSMVATGTFGARATENRRCGIAYYKYK